MKSIFLWGGVGILLVGGLLVLFTFVNPQQDAQSGVGGVLSVPITEADHRKGNLQSEIELVEYGDFQCPACRAYAPLLKQVEAEFGDRITMVYRHYPLSGHEHAKEGARAAEAAALQGKFWEMHDMLFEKQDEWVKASNLEDTFVGYAVALGLNPDQFRQDYNSEQVADAVQEDLTSALQEGLNSTPSFFFANQRILNPQSYAEFQQVITSVLQQSQPGPEGS